MEKKSKCILKISHHIGQVSSHSCIKQQGNMKNSNKRVQPKTSRRRPSESGTVASCTVTALRTCCPSRVDSNCPSCFPRSFLLLCLPETRHAWPGPFMSLCRSIVKVWFSVLVKIVHYLEQMDKNSNIVFWKM